MIFKLNFFCKCLNLLSKCEMMLVENDAIHPLSKFPVHGMDGGQLRVGLVL